MTKQNDPLAISLLAELPPDMSAEQAELLAAALKRTVVDFSRALSSGGDDLKIESVSGPADATRLEDISDQAKIPGVVLKHESVLPSK